VTGCTEVITSLMTLLERMASATPDPGAVVEDLSEFFGPLLFRSPDAAAKPSAQQTDSPLVAVRPFSLPLGRLLAIKRLSRSPTRWLADYTSDPPALHCLQVHSLSLMIRQAAYICKSADRIVEPSSDALTPVGMMPLLPAPDAVAGVINGTAARAPPSAASQDCALLPSGRVDLRARTLGKPRSGFSS